MRPPLTQPSSASRELPNLDQLRYLVQLLQKDDAVSALLRSCNEIGEAYLFGGAVRDAIFGAEGRFGDLDIFVSGPLDVDFVRTISTMSRRTNFGGMRLVVGKFDVDIWELPQSYAFRVNRGRAVSIPSLLETVCFSTDAVAVSLLDAKRVISTQKFRSSVASRSLSFVCRPVEVELLQSIRIARLVVKNRVVPDPEVGAYFSKAYEQFGAAKLVAGESKWRGRRVLDELLIARVHEICLGCRMEQDLFALSSEDVFDSGRSSFL